MHEQPELLHEQSELINEQPELLHEQPELLHEQPELLHEQPELLHEQPELLHEQPELLHEQPELINEQPELLHEQPEPINYKDTCQKLFNILFEKYKKAINQNIETKKLIEMACGDYSVFCSIKRGFDILADLIKYSIFSNSVKWEDILMQHNIKSIDDLININIKLPKSTDDLILIFTAYPWCIDNLNPEIFEIINCHEYEFMMKLISINEFLYFSTFMEANDADVVLLCKEASIALWANIKTLIEKALAHHINISKADHMSPIAD